MPGVQQDGNVRVAVEVPEELLADALLSQEVRRLVPGLVMTSVHDLDSADLVATASPCGPVATDDPCEAEDDEQEHTVDN